MKTKLISLSITLIALFSACSSESNEIIFPEETKFSFPEDWRYLTGDERIAALQIPEDILSKMSTSDLAEACMTYPLGIDYVISDEDEFDLIHNVVETFNGFAELKKRDHAFECILDCYNGILNNIRENTDGGDSTGDSFSLFYIEKFIISGYLVPVEQLKENQHFISLYNKAAKIREENKKYTGYKSMYTLHEIKKVLGIDYVLPDEENIPELTKNYFPNDWKYLESNDERWAALQLPEDQLSSMSTQELAEACMTYPLGTDCLAYNNYQIGIAQVITRFNGFTELKKREDAFDKVLDFYNKNLDYVELTVYSKRVYSNAMRLYYNEQFIISGYLVPVDQLKNNEKLISLYHKAEKIREKYYDLQSHASIETLYAMEQVLGLN